VANKNRSDDQFFAKNLLLPACGDGFGEAKASYTSLISYS